MTDAVLLHLVERDTWERALSDGRTALEPPSLDEVGFVHLSAPSQVAIPANRRFPGRTDMLLLVLDPRRLGGEVRWEEGDPPEGDLRFPHLYGPLPLEAVMSVVEYRPDGDGCFSEPKLP